MSPTTLHLDPSTGLPDGRALLAELGDPQPVRRSVELIAVMGAGGLQDPLLLCEDPRLPGRIGETFRTVASLRDGCAYRVDGSVYAIVTPAADLQSPLAPLAPVARIALEELDPQLGSHMLHARADIHPGADPAAARRALRSAFARIRLRVGWTPLSPGRQARDVLLELLAERRLTGSHTDRARLAADAVAVGRALALSSDELDVLVRAAELQDVGMLTLPESLLLKGTHLSPSEWALVQRHPVVGERIIASSPALARVGRIVRSSYERYDGSGYPDALAGEAIPLAARIVAVCVAYHAMTSPRAYRALRAPDEALAELGACAGSQFDPVVVAAFRSVVASDVAPHPAAA